MHLFRTLQPTEDKTGNPYVQKRYITTEYKYYCSSEQEARELEKIYDEYLKSISTRVEADHNVGTYFYYDKDGYAVGTTIGAAHKKTFVTVYVKSNTLK